MLLPLFYNLKGNMNKLIYSLCFLIMLIFTTAYAAPSQFVCDPKLKNCMEKILQVKEARDLISSIQKEGSLRIAVSDASESKQFGAFWDLDLRTVCVHLDSQVTEGEIIGSILFELHNALVTSRYDQLDLLARNGKINKADYVKAYEQQEYYNSKNASAIAEKGISLGIFPHTARLPTYRNFEEHYHYQKIGGHSAYVARNYDMLMSESQRKT